jgi:hypothetical protein
VSGLGFGTGLPGTDGAPNGGRVAEAARWIEDAGLDAIGTPALEPVVTLATAAAVTRRAHLDFGMLAASARPAVMLAAQVQTLQHPTASKCCSTTLRGLGPPSMPEPCRAHQRIAEPHPPPISIKPGRLS